MSTTDANTDSCNCSTRHPLQLDGTSQQQRMPDALRTSSVSVDERTLEDLLCFALHYAAKIRYYNSENEEDGNWEIFLRNDITILIAVISQRDLEKEIEAFSTLLTNLRNAPTVARFQKLFEAFKDMLTELNDWHKRSDEESLFHKELDIFYQSVFLPALVQLAAIDKAAGDALDAFNGELGEIIDGDDALTVTIQQDWNDYFDAEFALAASAKQAYAGNNDADRLKSAANLIEQLYRKFYNGYLSIIQRTSKYMAETLDKYPRHKAHVALLIAFIEIFKHAQDHINTLTQRHLEFFYDKVLQLSPREAVPDKVHVIFELAKQVSENYYNVPKGTLLKAGKDGKGKEIFFETDDDIIVTRAQVAAFKNLIIDEHKESGASALYAATDAKTTDGVDGALDKTVPQWSAFGDTQQNIETDSQTLPAATVGFALASPQLRLAEGKRNIELCFYLNDSPDADDTETLSKVLTVNNPGTDEDTIAVKYKAELTTEKGWYEVSFDATDTDEGIQIKKDSSGIYLSVMLTLDERVPAITDYNADLHGGTYTADCPVARITTLNYLSGYDTATSSGKTTYLPIWDNTYRILSKLSFTSAKIITQISEMRSTLSIHNEFSKIEGTKPFLPFGQQPVPGSPLYLGSSEIFFKKVDTLNIRLEWHGAPEKFSNYYTNYIYEDNGTSPVDSNDDFTASVEILKSRNWSTSSDTQGTITFETSSPDGYGVYNKLSSDNLLFDSTDARKLVKYSFTGLTNERASDEEVFDSNLTNATRGYIRFLLGDTDFQHKIFPLALAYNALQDGAPTLPLQPYTPQIKYFAVDYTSEQELDSDYDFFYHIHPFGEHQATLGNNLKLMPTFNYAADLDFDSTISPDPPETQAQTSMFFIALENFDPSLEVSVSMLVQVVEDSGDPNIEAPDVNWSYLRSNEWVSLTGQQVVVDTTLDMTTSGLIDLAIPEDATNDNTIFPSGYYWIRASVKDSAAALSKLIDIKAQAVGALFKESGNDPNRLATALKAETITKLAQSTPEIKGVTQPFASTGGKVVEAGNDYYRRVSERLRHKGRAITAWDYERLVLEYFPTIYKVKCISHTLNMNTAEMSCYTELSPGHVCMIVVSNLRNQNQVDLLKPTTSIAIRKEIKDFLQKRASRFACISVINPDYEEIQAGCKVVFLPEYQSEKGYYEKLLIEEITQFLSPWAYDSGADIVFGGRIHASYIIQFIEGRSYVDYLTDFEMRRLNADGSIGPALESIEASKAKSILVSAPTHNIKAVLTNETETTETC